MLEEERLGAGPGMHVFDSSMLPNLKLRDFFFRVADDKKIPLQADLVARYGQDAAAMQILLAAQSPGGALCRRPWLLP